CFSRRWRSMFSSLDLKSVVCSSDLQAATFPAGAIWCEPVKAQPVVLWSKIAVVQVMVLWHVEQFAAAKGAPAAECVGLLVCCQRSEERRVGKQFGARVAREW